ncbi:hypothetical protein BGE01nite_23870 [Brevifollis gellanilyticus]|uniref:Uncharacterized protein n=1 Tax=Brevifollis gellanilyticus TaxID=748831 RepID=A0A512M8M7_9BACT|nr:hypothetical protein BGE01nite_23870 [Brevifollis gellanilyticus]
MDTDGDGTTNYTYDDTNDPEDVDTDGLTTGQEAALGTDPLDPDSDDDGALDGSEVNIMFTNPLVVDSNGNGINDLYEYQLKHTDSDSDELSDWDETYVYFTSLTNSDTDSDGWADGYEVNTTFTSPLMADTDGDGLTDYEDEIVSTNPSGDFDNDGLTNEQEATIFYPSTGTRTRITHGDSDGDGLKDGYEVATVRYNPFYETKLASDPTLAVSYPSSTYFDDGDDPSFLFPSDIRPSINILGPESLPRATVGTQYVSPEFLVEGHSGGVTWSVIAGDLPSEFSFDGACLKGTGVSEGVYHFTVQVVDGDNRGTSINHVLVVEAPPPGPLAIVSDAQLPDATYSQSYGWSFAATGGTGGYTWSLPNGGLPPSLSLSTNGTLSGTPEATGQFTFVVRVGTTNANDGTCDQEVTLNIGTAPPVDLLITSSATLSDGQDGEPYSWSFNAQGGTGSYTWSIVSGALPPGLSLSGSEIAGNASLGGGATGTWNFTVQVHDGANSVTQDASISVGNAPPPGVEIYMGSYPDESIWTPFSIQFGCVDGQSAAWNADSLPEGVAMSSSGLLYGTMGAQGFSFSVTATNAYGSSDTKTITINGVDRDADMDGLNASVEHDLAVTWEVPMHDGSPTSNGGGNPAPHDWLVYYFKVLAVDDTAADVDGDGLGPVLEGWLGTDSTKWDSNDDFFSDRLVLYWSYHYFTDTTDTDGDGLHAEFEAALGTSDNLTDTDGDGLTDEWETYYISYSSPAERDTDDDGLWDGEELTNQTYARDQDSDDDYLTDDEEVHAHDKFGVVFALNPLSSDSDGDGVPDHAEVDLTDTDHGGIPDRLEDFWGLDKTNADDENGNLDSDEYTNVEAYQRGFDVRANWQTKFDTDGDSMDDVYELSRPTILNMSDPHDGADDPDGDFLTNVEEYRNKTEPRSFLTMQGHTLLDVNDRNDVTGELVLIGGQPVLRIVLNDYERVFRDELHVAALHRDNGSLDSARAYDDDWDLDSVSNYDELFPIGGTPTDPRSADPLPASPEGSLGNAVHGVPFSVTLSPSGGQAPYEYQLASGSSLPSGLSLLQDPESPPGSPMWQITGTVDSSAGEGDMSFALELKDVRGVTRIINNSIKVCSTLDASAGFVYYYSDASVSEPIVQTGGLPPYVFELQEDTSVTLPSALTLRTSDRFGLGEGQEEYPPSGRYVALVKVTDALGQSVVRNIELSFREQDSPPPPPPLSMSGNLPAVIKGIRYESAVSLIGGAGGYQVSLVAGSLPPGLDLTSSGGISGTMVNPGGEPGWSFTLRVTDNAGASFSRQFYIGRGFLPLTFNATFPPGRPLMPYGPVDLKVTGTEGEVRFEMSGSFPEGLEIKNGKVVGSLSGSTDPVTFTLTVKDDTIRSVSKTFTIVSAEPLTLSAPFFPAYQGATTAYGPVQLSATGGLGPYQFTFSPSLPEGLTLDPVTNQVSGMLDRDEPTVYGFSVTAIDALGRSTQRQVWLEVREVVEIPPEDPISILTPYVPVTMEDRLDENENTYQAKVVDAVIAAGAGMLTVVDNPALDWLHLQGRTLRGDVPGGFHHTYIDVAATPNFGMGSTQRRRVHIGVPVAELVVTEGATSAVLQDEFSVTFELRDTFTLPFGVPPPEFEELIVDGSNLPDWLSLTQDGRVVTIEGTADNVGTIELPCIVRQKASASEQTREYELMPIRLSVSPRPEIRGPIKIYDTTKAVATGETFNLAIPRSGGVAGASHFTIKTAPPPAPLLPLPQGVALNAETGVLAGQISSVGQYGAIVRVENNGKFSEALVKVGCLAPLTLSVPTLVSGYLNQPYPSTQFLTNAESPVFQIKGGSFPPGMALSASGVLGGRPSQVGSFSFSVSVTDAYKRSYSIPCSIRIRPSPTPPVPPNLPPEIPVQPGVLPVAAEPVVPSELPVGNPGSFVLVDDVPKYEQPEVEGGGPFLAVDRYFVPQGPTGMFTRSDDGEASVDNPLTRVLEHVPDKEVPDFAGDTTPCRNHPGETYVGEESVETVQEYEIISSNDADYDPDLPDPQIRWGIFRTFVNGLHWGDLEEHLPNENDPPPPNGGGDHPNSDAYAMEVRVEIEADAVQVLPPFKLLVRTYRLRANDEPQFLTQEIQEVEIPQGQNKSQPLQFSPTDGKMIMVTLWDSGEAEDGESDDFQFNDGAGSRYRKVGLNGVPMADSKPQVQDESGQRGEETYIDAYTTQLRHSVSDVFVEAEGSLLPLQVRRDLAPSCYNVRSGLRPSERPDLPFGPGWSSNVCSYITFEGTKATVVDEAGQSQVFQHVQGPFWYHNFAESDDAKSSQNVLVGDVVTAPVVELPDQPGNPGSAMRYGHASLQTMSSRGQLTLHKKFGTVCTYEELLPTELSQFYSNDRVVGSESKTRLQYARLIKVRDRLGNELHYHYPSYSTLIPSSIEDLKRPGYKITITQEGGKVVAVKGPGGDVTNYTYSQSAGLSIIRQVSDQAKFTPQDDVLLTQVQRGSAAVQYGHTLINEVEENDLLGVAHQHVAVSSITDERSNTYVFQLQPSSGTFVSVADVTKKLPKGSPLVLTAVSPPEGPPVIITKKTVAVAQGDSEITTSFTVRQSDGKDRVYRYEFADPVKPIPYAITVPDDETPTYTFTKMRIVDPMGGVEKFTFLPQAHFALSESEDQDGHKTTFGYGDNCVVKVKYGSTVVSFGVGKYDDPTLEINAMGHTKSFTYDPATRQLASVSHLAASGEGVVTSYGFENMPTDPLTQPYGRRLSEVTGYGSPIAFSGVPHAGGSRKTMEYENSLFPGIVTRETLSALPSSNPTASQAPWDQHAPPAGLAPSIVTKRNIAAFTNQNDYWWRTVIEERIIDGQTSTTKTIHDFNGNTASTEDALGRITRFYYDSRNRLTLTHFPDGAIKRIKYDPHGNIIQEQDECFRNVFHEYDALNRRVKSTVDLNGNGLADAAPADIVTSTSYNDLGLPVRQVDARGTVTELTYDLLGRPIRSVTNASATNPAERITVYFTDNHLTTPFVDPDTGLSKSRSQTKDFVGGSVFDVSGFKPLHAFDARGNETYITYDAIYRPLTKRAPDAGVVVFTYRNMSASPQPIAQAGPVIGANKALIYDCQDRLIDTYFADGSHVLQMLTPHGKPWKSISEDGIETTTHFDASGMPLRINVQKNSLSTSVFTHYDLVGNSTSVTDPRGNTTTTQYDARNRPTRVTHPLVVDASQPVGSPMVSPMISTVYDPSGRVLEVTDPQGAVTTKFYDPAGRLVKTVDDFGNESELTLDAQGNVLTTTNALDQTVTNVYDAFGRLIGTTDHSGIQNNFAYDAAGNRTSVTDGRGKTTTFAYDAQNRLITQTFQGSRLSYGADAVSDVWTYRYDGANKVSETSPKGLTTDYAYDLRNRLKRVTYDIENAMPESPRPYRDIVYDSAGRLTIVYESNAPDGCLSYAYDDLGRMISETRGGITYEPFRMGGRRYIAGEGVTHRYTYDLAGNRLSATFAHGRRTVTSYDAINRPLSIDEGPLTGFDAAKKTTRYGYDLAGRALTLSSANGQSTRNTYDSLGRLTHRQLLAPGAVDPPSAESVVASFSWTHDALGNVTSQSEQWTGSGGGTARARITSMSYDASNRLSKEEVREAASLSLAATAPRLVTGHAYDSSHNRISKTVTHPDGTVADAAEPTKWIYTYNNANQLVIAEERSPAGDTLKWQNLTYDLNGNRKSLHSTNYDTGGTTTHSSSYTWDTFNRLVQVHDTKPTGTQLWFHRYDYRTRRIHTTLAKPGEPVKYTAIVFSGGLSVSEHVADSSGAFTATTSEVVYTRGPDMGGGVGGLLFTQRSGITKFNLSNGRGDIVAQTNASGEVTWTASYEAFGKRTKETGTNADKQRGNSKDEDPTGLLNEGFRYRDLETGVWLSRDPAGFVDGPNLYAYVKQNPWTAFDPRGLALRVPQKEKSAFASYITGAGVSGHSSKPGTGTTLSGDSIVMITGTAKVTTTLQSEIVSCLIASPREFSFRTVADLDAHVKARIATVEYLEKFAKNVVFSSGRAVYPASSWKEVFTGGRRKDGSLRSYWEPTTDWKTALTQLRDTPGGAMDCSKPGEFARMMGDYADNKGTYDPRSNYNGNNSKTTPDAVADDWIPGDTGKLWNKNTNPPPPSHWVNENFTYLGKDRYYANGTSIGGSYIHSFKDVCDYTQNYQRAPGTGVPPTIDPGRLSVKTGLADQL